MDGRRRALIIGINTYAHGIPPLSSAVRDAKAVAERLERSHRYEVELLLDDDATGAAIMSALTRAADAGLTADDSFVLYFAGHGTNDQSDEPEGFMLAADAQRTKDDAWLPMAAVKNALVDGMNCRHLMVILDCCNAGSFRFTPTRAIGGVKRPLYKSQYERYRRGIAWQVLTAAAHDETADDVVSFTDDRGEGAGASGHSPFAQALIDGLHGAADTSRPDVAPDGVLTATELYQYIWDKVAVHDRQSPGIYPLKPGNKGEFVFNVPGVTPELVDDPPFDPSNSPWLGDRPYSTDDAHLYFGRSTATEALGKQVESRRFVAVVGASGSGKTSLLRAGLLPSLDSSDWAIAETAPLSSDPTAQLDDARAALTNRPADRRRLLVIDQFEDVVGRADDASLARFTGALRALVEAEDGPTVVIAVRSDSEARAATALGDLWSDEARFDVPDFTEDDLEDVVLGPALAKAVFFEPDGIVDDLVRAVARAPGAAPLLSSTLARLYRTAYDRHVANDPSDRTINHEDVSVVGGVVGVVRERANEVYGTAEPDGKEAMRRTLLRLVDQTAEGLTPRTVERSELRFGPEYDEQLDSVLADLVAARLVTALAVDGVESVKPAHPALVTTWDRQLEWLGASGSQDVVRRASEAARLWSESDGRSARSKHLWNQNPRLDNLDVRRDKGELNELERDFTRASLRRRKRLARIRRVAITSLVVLTVVAAVAGVLALIARSNAVREAERASSRALAADALINVESETDLAALLALESVRVANTTDARGSLAGLLSVPTRFLQRTNVHDADVTAIAFAETGRTAASADGSGVVALWDVNAEPFPPPQAAPLDVIETDLQIRDLFVTDDAEFPALAIDVAGIAWLLDFATGDHFFLTPPEDFVRATFNPDLSVFAGVTGDGMLQVYDVEDDLTFTPGPRVEVDPENVTDLTISPDGSTVVWGEGPDLAVWSWRDAEQPEVVTVVEDRLVRADIVAIALSPDADPGTAVIAVGMEDGTVVVADRTDPSLFDPVDPGPLNQLFDLAFKPGVVDLGDGDVTFTLASTHSNGDVNLYDVVPGDGFEPFAFVVDTLRAHNDEATTVAFAPDGRIASGDFSGEVIWWLDVPVSSLGLTSPSLPTPPMLDAAFLNPNEVVTVSVDATARLIDLEELDDLAIVEELPVLSADAAGDVIAVGLIDGSAHLLDQDGAILRTLVADHPTFVHVVALSADGDRLATVSARDEAGFDGHLALWDVATGTMSAERALPDGFEPTTALYGDDGVVWVGGRDRDSLPAVLEIDATSGEVLGELLHSSRPGNAVTALALSDDGRTLATGAMDRRIALWDTDTLDARRGGEFIGHRGNISGIVFWDDGDTLIASDDAGDVLMWDVSERRRFAQLGGPADDLLSLEVERESATLLAAGEDGYVWTWTLDPEEWRVRACELAGRNMTQSEWELYGDGGIRVRHCVDFPAEEGDVRDADYSESLTD